MIELVRDLPGRLRREGQQALSDPHEWVLLVGNRLVIAGVVTAAFALCVAALMRAAVVDVRSVTPMVYLFSTLVGGNITLVTIVLSINQLVLSRELRAPGELHDQMENVLDYRHRVEATTERNTVPVTPNEFLVVLLDGVRTNAQRLGGAVRGLGDDRLVEDVDSLVSDLSSHADDVTSRLEQSDERIFSTLAVVLESNYSRQLNELRRIDAEYEDELRGPVHDALDETVTNLQQVDIARQYFKSIYVQSELALLSRLLLYVGVPAIGSALLALFVYSGVDGTAGIPENLRAYVLLAVTLGFAPLAVLFAVVLRIATVAQRTVAITPFTTPAQRALGGEGTEE